MTEQSISTRVDMADKELANTRLETLTPPRTPTSTATAAHRLYTEIQDIYTALCKLDNLAPGPQINELLTRLVKLCIEPYSAHFITNFFSIHGVQKLCEALRPICAAAEGELETYWAQRILQDAQQHPNPSKDLLTSFPYHQNYVDLSRLELSSLTPFFPTSTSPSKFLFIGSGPLPLTSLCILTTHPHATVHNIDRDPAALNVSRELCKRLGYSGMSFSCEDVNVDGSADWGSYEVVFLAALVGMANSDKMRILAGLAKRLKKGTLVVARSARGLRSVLYPVLEIEEDFGKLGLEVLVEVHPWTEVVNSVVVLRVK